MHGLACLQSPNYFERHCLLHNHCVIHCLHVLFLVALLSSPGKNVFLSDFVFDQRGSPIKIIHHVTSDIPSPVGVRYGSGTQRPFLCVTHLIYMSKTRDSCYPNISSGLWLIGLKTALWYLIMHYQWKQLLLSLPSERRLMSPLWKRKNFVVCY